jgi:hypothetical protein
MTKDEAQEYSASIGQIGEGWWRQIAWAHRQGIPMLLGLTTREWAEKYCGYLKIAVSERREAIMELAAEGLSNRAIADVIGVAEGTIRNDKNAHNYAPGAVAQEGRKSAFAQNYASKEEWIDAYIESMTKCVACFNEAVEKCTDK